MIQTSFNLEWPTYWGELHTFIKIPNDIVQRNDHNLREFQIATLERKNAKFQHSAQILSQLRTKSEAKCLNSIEMDCPILLKPKAGYLTKNWAKICRSASQQP